VYLVTVSHLLQIQKIKRYWPSLLRRLVEPAACFVLKAHRRRLRFLSFYLLIYAVLCLLGSPLLLLNGDKTWYLVLIAGVILMTGYFTSRTRHYRQTTLLAVGAPIFLICGSIISRGIVHGPFESLMWLALPLLVAGLVLDFRKTVVVVVVYASAIIVTILIAGFPAMVMDSVVPYLFMVFLFTLLSAAVHAQDKSELMGEYSLVQQGEKKIMELYEKEKAQRLELEEEAKARNLFISILAHDLRTPLTPIVISSEAIYEISSSNQESIQFRLAEKNLDSVRVLAQRLEELLDLTNLARGTFALKANLFDIGTFLKTVGARFFTTLEKQRQSLVLEIPEGLPYVSGDSSRLEQVLVNLLSNASKYSPEGSDIGLRLKADDRELIVEVQDQGTGIAVEEQDKLFQPYHRVQQDRQGIPGSGLGLAICKGIIEAHGGKIWVVSSTCHGSTFAFSLPVKQPNEFDVQVDSLNLQSLPTQ
jgi:signal transduction histidine kinase